MNTCVSGLLISALMLVANQAHAQETEYIVGPKDVINISVWRQPTMSGPYTVDEDGAVHMPLVGPVAVRGLTRKEVEAAIGTALAAGYVRAPQVTVSIEQFRSQKIFVTGEVRQPGEVALSGRLSLLEALARAGSVTERAGLEAIIARPKNAAARTEAAAFDGTSDITRVNLADLQNGNLAVNVLLRDGDTVFVPRAATVHVLGEVRSPGEYPIFPGSRVAEVLSRAGGVSERGASGRVRVMRVVGGKNKELKVTLQDTLQPGDIVFVRERVF
jgi:polysaccharide export outer membrane protein